MVGMHFDRLARAIGIGATRRTTLGLGAAGLLGVLGLDDADAKKRKKKCKKCGPCQKCKKGKCKPKAAGTSCGEGRQCFANGECVSCDVCLGDCAFTSLQDAIDASADGSRIQLCPGNFSTTLSMNAKTLTVVGAGSGKGGTVLDGQGRDGVLSSTSSDLDIRQLTIRGGVTDSAGAGIFAFQTTLTLEDVHLTGNETDSVGGGLYAYNCEVTLINSDVTGNRAADGGGIRTDGGTLRLTAGSSVTGNTATEGTGGGIATIGGTIAISPDSRVSGNEPDDCAGTTAC